MDLRIVKTKKAIREAFLMQRANEPLEKVKVQSLCTLALVNKTTFYKYYPDVFVLAEELETEAVALLVDRLRTKDCLFTDPKRFVTELLLALETHHILLRSLFRDRPDTLFAKLGAQLARDCQRAAQVPEQPLLCAFAVGGLLHALHAGGAWPREPQRVRRDGAVGTDTGTGTAVCGDSDACFTQALNSGALAQQIAEMLARLGGL